MGGGVINLAGSPLLISVLLGLMGELGFKLCLGCLCSSWGASPQGPVPAPPHA